MDTGRQVGEIHDSSIDMKTLLEAKGQDYTSLCNEIRDKALFADTQHITEDILLIAVLVKAVQDTRFNLYDSVLGALSIPHINKTWKN